LNLLSESGCGPAIGAARFPADMRNERAAKELLRLATSTDQISDDQWRQLARITILKATAGAKRFRGARVTWRSVPSRKPSKHLSRLRGLEELANGTGYSTGKHAALALDMSGQRFVCPN
jgi:hypothetical protein